MMIKPIHTEADYQSALAAIESLWDAPEGSAEADQLEVLSMLVEAYEKTAFSIQPPDPVDFLGYVMETRGLTRKDLEPYIGPRGRVSDILNRVRPLTLEMIRRLAAGLKLPASVLIQEYPLRREAA
ncbi:Transcription regulator with HTH domain [Candidatus Accumulibacter aalborgensis]|uniref:Transcription regulator with HTH domain n=1 Tax=Candidatus Accumulibacter aalborgensis TaxID=1860102 RepID=A0A1A8XRE6_9PROT|nr:transcriptional regulator [Candidatus Accumulibacter aalborgensis]SBT07241.1 Transcription regulator with HTH domain [Candidatus Accumulibacter aalborgensis]